MDIWEKIRDEDCTACELYKTAQSVCLLGNGPYPCDYMLVGEAPGKREDDLKKVFQNVAGRNLDAHLKRVGLTRDDVYITNIVKCRPPDNRTPTQKEIKACRFFFLQEIKMVKPKYIIAMGAPALKGVAGNKVSVKKARHKILSIPEFPNIKVVGTYHPMAEGYEPYIKGLVEEDFDWIFGKSKAPEEIEQDYTMVTTIARAYQRLDELTSVNKPIAVDFETTGLDVRDPEFYPLTVAFCREPGEAFCVPLGHPESPIPEVEWKQFLHYVWETILIMAGHNLKYELKVARSQRIRHVLFKIKDTLLAVHLDDENYPGKSLMVLKRRFTDLGEEEESLEGKKDKLKEEPLTKVARYNCEDVDGTIRVGNIFWPKLKGKTEILYEELNECTQLLAEMEYDGCKIDVDRLDRNIELFSDKMTEIQNSFPNINLNSTDQLGVLLYETLGLPIIAETETGKPAVDAETLRELSGTVRGRKHKEIFNKILTYKKLEHFDSHFLTGMTKKMRDDFLYVEYNLAKFEGTKGKDVGTVTGRLSATLIHQIPRDNEELDKIFGEDAVQIREMFISRFEGGIITKGDFSQIELRLMAEYAEEQAMIEDFNSGVDIHTSVTNRLMKKAPRFYERYSEFDAKRKATKTINFGIIYGISAPALAERLGIHISEAKYIIDSWFKTYPGVLKWVHRTENEVIRNGYITSLLGRVRRLPGADRGSPVGRRILRQAVNSPIQGLASDICIIQLKKVWQSMKFFGMKSKPIILLHDEMVIDTHPKEKEDVKELIEKFSNNPDLSKFGVTLKTPIRIDVAQRRTWSKKGDD